MIEITPAILEPEFDSLLKCLDKFLEFGDIDIDICGKDFAGNETPGVERLLTAEKISAYDEIGFHFMVNDAQNQLDLLLNSYLAQKRLRIYIHQNEGFLANLNSKLPQNWKLGVYILREEDLESLDYYSSFDEVQLMTVTIGFQGGGFDAKVLEKVDRLRSLGYNGKVSVDGGVDLDTAKLLRSHRIDRVSVGSYFKKAKDPDLAYDELYQALNE